MELARAIGQFHIIPRQYFKASQIMSLAKELIFHVLVLGFYFNVNGYSFWHALYFTVFVSGLRFFLKIVCLRFYDRKAKDKEKSLNRILYSFWGLGLFTSIGVILLGNSFAPWPVFSLYAGISGLIMWAYSFYRLDTYVDLNQLALSVVTHETMKERVASIENLDSLAVKVRNEDIVVSQKKKLKKIDSLSGIAYLNALFLQRLGKHLRKGVIYRLLFLALVIGLEVILLHRYGKDVGPLKQRDFIRILYMSLVSGYLLYVGESYIKFCFYHLDRPLLKFNDYRRRDVIIASLKTRFWSLIRHNLPIFGMVNLGLVILYVSLFPVVFSELLLIVLVQFLSMAFFSLYFLYLYFLLQPFTEGLKSKSFLYTSLTWLVYFGGYQLYRFVESMTLLIFSFMLLGMFVFLVVGFCAVYYLAPKTFRLK
ncbi:hypothetical protein N1495_07045 [Streptococcus didelphis]|uniref:Uncharacterized protein n=2 Tax=Streptococcus didelphis TaxID=102886 RepID=A0ABY9LI17_9STRE|nr:hypothetical protein [Streptococcus didelphis]WMB28484.1 hypothetical protein N1496_02615 [Streptococcus didelphis]WMB29159.1 hypothetical protein N1495_07045 [Streptococcus didelphis]